MKRIAVISAILENPRRSQAQFNAVVGEYKDLIRGRMGIPIDEHDMACVSITAIGQMDQLNALTGRLGKLEGVTVKTAVAKKEIE